MDYKTLLGALAITVQIIGYIAYFIGIFKGKTKPHAFTWFVFSVVNIVAFIAVLTSGGGAGSWVLGMNVFACSAIALIGLRQKQVAYDMYDWLALTGALIGVFLWWLTDNPLYAVVLVAFADAIGSIPTFRKAYRKPFEENALSFFSTAISHPLAILALRSFALVTWFYSASLIFIDLSLVILILIRREQVKTFNEVK